MSNDLTTIARKLAAKRYAQMFAAAAAAEEQIKVLTDALAESEDARMSAESELSALTYPDNFPRVWGNATEPPPPEVVALIDITNGTPYRRQPHSDDLWDRMGVDHKMSYEWPIADAGPFIALPEDWGLSQLAKTLDTIIADHEKIRRSIYGRPGYDDPEATSRWTRPGLGDATGRVLDLLSARNSALSEENRRLKDRIATYEPTTEES